MALFVCWCCRRPACRRGFHSRREICSLTRSRHFYLVMVYTEGVDQEREREREAVFHAIVLFFSLCCWCWCVSSSLPVPGTHILFQTSFSFSEMTSFTVAYITTREVHHRADYLTLSLSLLNCPPTVA